MAMFQVPLRSKLISTYRLDLPDETALSYNAYYTDSDDDNSDSSINMNLPVPTPSRCSTKAPPPKRRSRWSSSARGSRYQHLQGSTACRTTSGYIRDIKTPDVPRTQVIYMDKKGTTSPQPHTSPIVISLKANRDSIRTPYSQQTRSNLLSAVHKAWYRNIHDQSKHKRALTTNRAGHRRHSIAIELADRPKTSMDHRQNQLARYKLVGFGSSLSEIPNVDINQLQKSSELVAERLKMMVSERRARSNLTAEDVREMRRRRLTGITKVEEPVKIIDPDKPSKLYRKFRLIAILAVTMVKLLWVIIEISETKSIRTAAELQWQTLYSTRRSDRKLSFDKTLYTRERASTTMPNWAIRILDTPPHLRNEQDCRKIHTMMRGMRSFDKFTENIQFSLCRAFTYQRVTEGRVILRKGHVGYNFYFVFSGSAFVNVEDVSSTGEKFVKTEAVVKKGDSFGELALLQNVTRTATVAVRETIELLVVHQDVFANVCPQIFEKELREKEEFLRKLPLFSEKWWSHQALRNLCLESQIQEYSINKLIVKDSRKDGWIYICMEGKAQIIRCLTLEEDEAEDRNLTKRRQSSPFLSEDLLELVRKLTPSFKQKEKKIEPGSVSRGGETDDKKKLLESLGLEYVETGKRKETFIEELEENERKKEMEYIQGPKTLSSLMAEEISHGKTDLVYLNIGMLNPRDIFDIYSIINEERKNNSYHLLVSYGTRMLKIKRSDLFRYSSPEAIEHGRNIIAKNQYPSDAVLLESYRGKTNWDDYKTDMVLDLLKPHLDNRTKFPQGHLKVSQARHAQQHKQSKLLNTLKKNEKRAKMDEKEMKIEESRLQRRQSADFAEKSLDVHHKHRSTGVKFSEPILIRRKTSMDLGARQDTLDLNIPLDKKVKRSKSLANIEPISEEEEDEEQEENITTPKRVVICE